MLFTWNLLRQASVLAIAVPPSAAAVFSSVQGFSCPSYTSSFGGKAICLSGKVRITANATNTKINYNIPDQFNATQTIQELLSPYTDIYTTTNGGPAIVSGSYALAARLCFPADEIAAEKVTTVQLLTHGATLDSTYWDFAPGYSYIDAAVAAGYATFSYDRLGVGDSEHPDPIQVVQGSLQVEILHQLALQLRAPSASGFGRKGFSHVVGIGHSAGATFTQAVSAKYPRDFDAVVLSGITTSVSTVAAAEAAFDLVIANTQERFEDIANGYFTFGSGQPGVQFAYFKYPHFDSAILAKQTSTIQTNTLGELLTFGSIVGPATAYTNPAYILNGANDYVFCGGNCSQPLDQNAAALAFFYPAVGAKGKSGQEPNAGHNVFQHKGAPGFYTHVLDWVRSNGL